MEPVEMQLSSVLVLFVAGMTLGFMFDLYRLFRTGIRPKRILDWIFDFLFWVVISPVLLFMIFYGNWGDMRFYIFIAIGLGVVFYLKVFSGTMRGLVRNVILSVVAVIRGIARIIRRIVIDPALWVWDLGACWADRTSERGAGRRAARMARKAELNAARKARQAERYAERQALKNQREQEESQRRAARQAGKQSKQQALARKRAEEKRARLTDHQERQAARQGLHNRENRASRR